MQNLDSVGCVTADSERSRATRSSSLSSISSVSTPVIGDGTEINGGEWDQGVIDVARAVLSGKIERYARDRHSFANERGQDLGVIRAVHF